MSTGRSRAARGGPSSARALTLLHGTWRTEGQLVGVAPSPRSTLAAVDRYEWLPGLDLLAHYVAGHLGARSVASFEVWRYDRTRRAYVSTSFDERGETATFRAHLRGRRWSVDGETQRFRGAFSADGETLTGTWEQKHGRAWKPWMTITLRKAGG